METANTSGSFADFSCPRLLAQLHRNRFGGTLRVTQGTLLKLLYFQAGEIAMASSNDPSDHLAPILIREGKLKAEQLDLARKSAKPGTSLARVLVQMGFLTSGELFAGARMQLRQIVASLLPLTDARYEIQSDYFPREITSLNMNTRELLLDLVNGLADRSFVLSEVGSPDSPYAPAAEPSGTAGAARLPRGWREFVDRFTAPLTIHEFGQGAGLDDFTASKVVYGLQLLGMLEPAMPKEKPEPERPPEVAPSPQRPTEATRRADEPGPVGVEAPVPAWPEAKPSPPARVDVGGAKSVGEAVAVQPAGARIPDSAGTGIPAGAPAIQAAHDPFTEPSPVAFGGRELVAGSKPIRLEFREPAHAPPTPGATRSAGPWGILSILTGLAVLGAGSFWFVFLRDSPSGSGAAPEPAAQEITTAETAAAGAVVPDPAIEAPVASAPSSDPGVPGGTTPLGAEEASQQGDEPETVPPPGEPSSHPPAAAESVTASREPPVSEAARRAGAPEVAQDIPDAPPFQDAARFLEARSHLERGESQRAAASWREVVRGESAKGFTLQIAIACREETLRRAASRSRGSSTFFAVPFTLQGKPCYRLCWGGYLTIEEAQAAKATVPGFFLAEGGSPVVVSLGRLVSKGSP